jgi:lipopolysaccharide biosynthesis glycosyltransferase
MNLTRLDEKFRPISDEQVAFLNEVVASKNPDNKVTKVDVTDIYEKEFGNCKNETAYCTPYTLLRLLADLVPNMPDKLLYLDIDMMIADDLNDLYSKDVSNVEFLAVKEKYGCWLIWHDYFNAGMLLFNMKKLTQTHLLEKARELIRTKKMMFADQDAIYRSKTKMKFLPRRYNEQSKFDRKDTLVCHFCKRLLLWPWFKIVNIKQWHIDDVHKYYKCTRFDNDLDEYIKLKDEFEKRKVK